MDSKIEQVKKILYQGYLTDIAAEKINALYSEPHVVCPEWGGTGENPQTIGNINCESCHGTGKLSAVGGVGDYLHFDVDCHTCNGTGKVPTKQVVCPHCEGSGRFYADSKVHYAYANLPTVPCAYCDGTGKVSACIPVPSTPAIEKYYWWCPNCKEEVDPTRVTFKNVMTFVALMWKHYPLLLPVRVKFNNALEADALDWDTRNIKSKFTSEEILGHIEVLSKSFYDKYAGKGLTPSEVMELHKSEYWELVINFIEAPLRAEIAELKG